jgi:GT2 family glycosyltransferase
VRTSKGNLFEAYELVSLPYTHRRSNPASAAWRKLPARVSKRDGGQGEPLAVTHSSSRAHATSKGARRDKAQLLVSIIIPHCNDLQNLQTCLDLLAVQTIPSDQYEIIVADNNSDCGLAAVTELCGTAANVVHASIQGAGAARNAGVKAAHARYLAFLDSDCRPARDWLERGLAALAAGDLVGGRVDVDVNDNRNLTAVEAFEVVFAFNNKRYVEREGFSVTANMFISRASFEKVGGFRVGVSEDKDWGWRAMALGLQWTYAPDVRVSHPARRDWDDLCRKWRRIMRESYLLTREQPFGRLVWALRAWLILCSSAFHALTVLRSPKLLRLGDRMKAMGVLFRTRWWRFIESHKLLLAK